MPSNITECDKCGELFTRKNGTNMYCDNCRIIKCYYCGKEFKAKWTYQITKQKVYCSKHCANSDIAQTRYKGKKELAQQKYKDLHKEQYSKTHKYDGYGLFWNIDLWIHGPNGDEPIYKYLYKKYIGEIPEGYVIHHKDGNHNNNCLYNLECISRAKHICKHNINRWGHKDPTKENKQVHNISHNNIMYETKGSGLT